MWLGERSVAAQIGLFRIRAVLGVLLFAFADDDLTHARTVYLVPPQVGAIEDDLVADFGGTTELAEDETADSVEVFALEARVQCLVD